MQDLGVIDIVVEVKAKKEFAPEDFIQIIAYLKASKMKTGLLINFGSDTVKVKRFAN